MIKPTVGATAENAPPASRSQSYNKWLFKLQQSASNRNEQRLVAIDYLNSRDTLLPQFEPQILANKAYEGSLQTDKMSMRLLTLKNQYLLDSHLPIFINGDGNCLFRAVSMLCYGTEDHHQLLRLLCACEVILNPDLYDKDYLYSYTPFRNAKYLVIPSLVDVINELLCQKSETCQKIGYVGVVGILAASTIIQRPIQTFYPLTSIDGIYSEHNQTLVGRGVSEKQESIRVLWTTTVGDEATWNNINEDVNINHFAALVRLPTPSAHHMETNIIDGQ